MSAREKASHVGTLSSTLTRPLPSEESLSTCPGWSSAIR